MNIGCFALVAPFQPLAIQLERINAMGFAHADVTDNTDGACLRVEFGFTALASLEIAGEDAVKTSAARLREWWGITSER